MPCTWPVDRTCYTNVLPEDPGELPETPTPEEQAAYDTYQAAITQQNASEDLAVGVLYALSGRQFGLCTALARPCAASNPLRFQGATNPWEPFVPIFWGGVWQNVGCGCLGSCETVGPRLVHLPGPVNEIVTVTIDGVDLDTADYVLEGNVLYRVGASWPPQDMGRPLGEDNTWSVEYLRGWPPPAGAAFMVGLLTKEFLAACNDSKCRLPRNVVGVNRNGVSYQIYDPSTLMSSGKTGLSEVDLWLAAVNPNALMSAPTVI